MVGEFSSSKHDVGTLSMFFNYIKFEFEKHFKDLFAFRLVVIDYSFASIHSILNTLNKMEIIEYAKHILEISEGKANFDPSKSYLVSCVAHTMKRFSKSIKPIEQSKEQHAQICYYFSLLLNSTTMLELKTYFEHITVFKIFFF